MARAAEPMAEGARYGKLTVISAVGIFTAYGKRLHYTLFSCDCGTEVLAATAVVRNGYKTRCKSSCGRDYAVPRSDIAPYRDVDAPGWYRSWRAARARCHYAEPSSLQGKNYRGRGIQMCDKWLKDPMAFYMDMGDRPEGMTLDREDVDGNYEPGNCKWATPLEQAKNKRKK